MNIEILKDYMPIYIIGHSHIDLDSAVSSKILCDILNSKGIKCHYCILNEEYVFDKYNKNMLDSCMEFNPIVIDKSDVNNHNYFLVDHNDRMQSVGFNATVVGAIDHHPNANNVDNVILTDRCCLSLFLYELFKDNYNFSNEEKYQIYMAFLNDSAFGKADRYREEDGLLADELGFGHDYDSLFKKYFIPTDLSKGVESQMSNGLKHYKFDDVVFDSNYIETYGIDGLEDYKEIVLNKDAFLGRWVDYLTDTTYIYFKYDNKIFHKKYNCIASRATTILNDVLDYLKKNNYLE